VIPFGSDSSTTPRSTELRGWLWYGVFVTFVLWLCLLLLLRF
jgi:hypothetical protein